MPKLHEKYETMVVYSLKNGEESVEGLKNKFTALIEANAELISVNEWGKRRLAYPINYENDGYYVLYGFDCKPDFPKELERILNITEGVIRFLTVVRMDTPAKPEADTPAEEPASSENEPAAEELKQVSQAPQTEEVEEAGE
jgi:small subunit ribosomal protein S6